MKPRCATRDCSILVVDDDVELARTLQEFLEGESYAVEVAFSAAEAVALAQQNPCLCVALVDLIMPVTDGIALMGQLHGRDPNLAVIIMTGYGTIETAIEAVKRGAEDYVTKPFDREAIRKKIARLMEVFELRTRVEQLETHLEHLPSFESFICASPLMRRALERACAAAKTDASILLLGETGTGKEMLARAIHAASARTHAPFLPVNCGALPHDLVESELFGFRRGAFTGAYSNAPGIFATAAGGTVFLDEVGEMPKDAQVKLLRVLQEGELRPVGSPTSVHVDVRLVSATNRPLAELRNQRLREDLYYRIATIVVEVPPLRARPEDIIMLAQHFVHRLARRYGRQIILARCAVDALVNYPFPGNVRELENILEGVTALSVENPQKIAEKELKPLLEGSGQLKSSSSLSEQPLSLERLEHFAIQQALRLCQG
ncbi:MAG: sigma-54-dependent Fis family transcriptional regulator, partial [Acidobacteria bacterium]|nr:sigma-54-dependent Fis family transcriptional regulator [Acidobacteriota bacterium]